MLNIGIIGIGNTGNQIALLANQKLSVPVLCINSSEKDLETIPNNIPKRLLKDKTGLSLGAGKDRKTAKKLLKESLNNLLSDDEVTGMIRNLDNLYIISSTGGGTGSGTAPLMYEIIKKAFDVNVILVGVLPTNEETLDSQLNTIGYLDELYNILDNPTYMLYDNSKLDIPYHDLLQKVNNEIVDDINVMRCMYNISTNLDSIDDKDAMRILSTPGRLLVSRTENIRDKDVDTSDKIESLIINSIKQSSCVELQRDKNLVARGLICNISEDLSAVLNSSLPKINDVIGEPLKAFKHIYINENNEENNIFTIMAGLSQVKDRLEVIESRVEGIQEKRKDKDVIGNDVFSRFSSLQDELSTEDEELDDTPINPADIFNKFM